MTSNEVFIEQIPIGVMKPTATGNDVRWEFNPMWVIVRQRDKSSDDKALNINYEYLRSTGFWSDNYTTDPDVLMFKAKQEAMDYASNFLAFNPGTTKVEPKKSIFELN